MNKFLAMLKHELKIMKFELNLTKSLILSYLFILPLISLFSLNILNDEQSLIFFILISPIILISNVVNIFKNDLSDGSLELTLTIFSPSLIVIVKFLSVTFSLLLSYGCILPITWLIFKLSLINLVKYSLMFLSLNLFAGSLLILINAMSAYFKTATNHFSILIIPMLIPLLIIADLSTKNFIELTTLLFLTSGITLIFLPLILMLTTYLLQNIYNV